MTTEWNDYECLYLSAFLFPNMPPHPSMHINICQFSTTACIEGSGLEFTKACANLNYYILRCYPIPNNVFLFQQIHTGMPLENHLKMEQSSSFEFALAEHGQGVA